MREQAEQNWEKFATLGHKKQIDHHSRVGLKQGISTTNKLRDNGDVIIDDDQFEDDQAQRLFDKRAIKTGSTNVSNKFEYALGADPSLIDHTYSF